MKYVHQWTGTQSLNIKGIHCVTCNLGFLHNEVFIELCWTCNIYNNSRSFTSEIWYTFSLFPNFFVNVDFSSPVYQKMCSPKYVGNLLEDGQEIKSCQIYPGKKTLNTGTQGRKVIAMLNKVLWNKKIIKKNKHQLIYNNNIKSIVKISGVPREGSIWILPAPPPRVVGELKIN